MAIAIKRLKHNRLNTFVSLLLDVCGKTQIFDEELSFLFLDVIQNQYLDKKRISSKNQYVHVLVFKVANRIMSSVDSMIQPKNATISQLFQVALGLVNRYLKRNNVSDETLILALKYIFATLSSNGIEQYGLVNTKQQNEPLKLKDSKHETAIQFYFDYFIFDVFNSQRLAEGREFIIKIACKSFRRFMIFYPQHLYSIVKSLHALMIGLNSHDQHLEETIADTITDILVKQIQTGVRFQDSVALLYIQQEMFKHHMLHRVLSGLVSYMKDFQRQIVQFAINQVTEKTMYIQTLGTLAQHLDNRNLLSAIVKIFCQYYSDAEVRGLVVYELEELSLNCPDIVIAEVIEMTISSIIHSETDKKSDDRSNIFEQLVDFLKLASLCSKSLEKSGMKLQEVWSLIKHL